MSEMGTRCLAFAEALGMDVWRGLGKGGRGCTCSVGGKVCHVYLCSMREWFHHGSTSASPRRYPILVGLFLHHGIARAMLLPRADSILGFSVRSAACLERLLVVVYTVHRCRGISPPSFDTASASERGISHVSLYETVRIIV